MAESVITKNACLGKQTFIGGGGVRNRFSKLYPFDRFTSLRLFCAAFSCSDTMVSPFSKICMNEN
jgi:hypothetical protein